MPRDFSLRDDKVISFNLNGGGFGKIKFYADRLSVWFVATDYNSAFHGFTKKTFCLSDFDKWTYRDFCKNGTAFINPIFSVIENLQQKGMDVSEIIMLFSPYWVFFNECVCSKFDYLLNVMQKSIYKCSIEKGCDEKNAKVLAIKNTRIARKTLDERRALYKQMFIKAENAHGENGKQRKHTNAEF